MNIVFHFDGLQRGGTQPASGRFIQNIKRCVSTWLKGNQFHRFGRGPDVAGFGFRPQEGVSWDDSRQPPPVELSSCLLASSHQDDPPAPSAGAGALEARLCLASGLTDSITR